MFIVSSELDEPRRVICLPRDSGHFASKWLGSTAGFFYKHFAPTELTRFQASGVR